MNITIDKTGAAFDYGIHVMTIYAVAATNLYGLISLEELAKVANGYRNSPSSGGSPQPTKYAMYTKNPDDIRMPRNIKPDDVMEYLNMNAKTQNYVVLIDYRGTRYLASRDFVILEDGKEDRLGRRRADNARPRGKTPVPAWIGGVCHVRRNW